jgi:hypothetical protein
MTDIVKGMARVLDRATGGSGLADKEDIDAMRAALLWLADNVSDEMVQAYHNERERVLNDDWFPSISQSKYISAAIRAAAGEEGK